jgi:hypothetical protein
MELVLITAPADGTVTTAKLADSSVTTAKLNDASVSLAKLTATGTKDATTFLRGDNTFASPAGGANTPAFQATSNSQTIADQTFVKITSWNEVIDTDSGWDNSNAKFQPTTAGKYLVYGFIQKELASNAQLVGTAIYKNGSAYETAWENDANFTIGRSTNHLTTLVQMNGTTDYLEFYGYANVSSGTVNASGGTFSAFKLIGV